MVPGDDVSARPAKIGRQQLPTPTDMFGSNRADRCRGLPCLGLVDCATDNITSTTNGRMEYYMKDFPRILCLTAIMLSRPARGFG
jgi:hypothetical protein